MQRNRVRGVDVLDVILASWLNWLFCLVCGSCLPFLYWGLLWCVFLHVSIEFEWDEPRLLCAVMVLEDLFSTIKSKLGSGNKATKETTKNRMRFWWMFQVRCIHGRICVGVCCVDFATIFPPNTDEPTSSSKREMHTNQPTGRTRAARENSLCECWITLYWNITDILTVSSFVRMQADARVACGIFVCVSFGECSSSVFVKNAERLSPPRPRIFRLPRWILVVVFFLCIPKISHVIL